MILKCGSQKWRVYLFILKVQIIIETLMSNFKKERSWGCPLRHC